MRRIRPRTATGRPDAAHRGRPGRFRALVGRLAGVAVVAVAAVAPLALNDLSPAAASSCSGTVVAGITVPPATCATLPALPVTVPTVPVTLPTVPVTLPTVPVTLPSVPVPTSVPVLPVATTVPPTTPITSPTTVPATPPTTVVAGTGPTTGPANPPATAASPTTAAEGSGSTDATTPTTAPSQAGTSGSGLTVGPVTVGPVTGSATAQAARAVAVQVAGAEGVGGSEPVAAAPLTESSPAATPSLVGRAVAAVAPRRLPLPWLVAAIVLLLTVAAAYLLTVRQEGMVLLPAVDAPPLFWRIGGYVSAALLAITYLLTATSVLMTLLTDWLPGAGGATLPGAGLYKATAVLLSVILTGIAVRYVYYYWCWIRSRHHFGHPEPVDVAVLQARTLPYLKFQVTTRGDAQPIVQRTVQALVDIAAAQPWLAPKMSVEIVTESFDEAGRLPALFGDAKLDVHALCLPRNYQTPNRTGLKARALHYMVERRLEGWNRKPGRTFVVHLDEETLVTEEHLLVLVEYLSNDPRPVSQGPILYPIEWENTPWLCRAMESLRPFGCSECAQVMNNPPPPHLHGSNLVVDEDVENRIGWDFGLVDGQPYIAEDLLFGMRAYALLGREAFGWHGATMFEQPPLSVYWAVQQRLRWVLGALQGWRAMGNRDDLQAIPARERSRLRRAVGFRVATYALGFPVGFAGLFFLLHPATRQSAALSPLGVWRLFIILAGVGWVLSYQIGLARNLRYQNVSWWARLRQHATLLILTPFTGLFETAGPFLALTRWLAGARQARWTPTPKTIDPVPVGVPRPVGRPLTVP